MPRRKVIAKREVIPDPLFQSQLVTKFMNCIMERGKKSTAEGIFYGAMDEIRERTSRCGFTLSSASWKAFTGSPLAFFSTWVKAP